MKLRQIDSVMIRGVPGQVQRPESVRCKERGLLEVIVCIAGTQKQRRVIKREKSMS